MGLTHLIQQAPSCICNFQHLLEGPLARTFMSLTQNSNSCNKDGVHFLPPCAAGLPANPFLSPGALMAHQCQFKL